MTVRFAPGFDPPEIPDGWGDDGDGLACLGCRRRRVVEIAEARFAEDARKGWKYRRAVQRALVEFELRRDPHRPDQSITRVARTTAKTVAEIRRGLVGAG